MSLPAVGEAGSPRVQVGDRVEDLDTPLILADLDRMERNIRDWQSWMDERGVAFRVHAKTHKVPEVALLQTAAGARRRATPRAGCWSASPSGCAPAASRCAR